VPDFMRKLRGRKPAPRLTDEDVDLEQFFTDAEHACQVFEQMVSAAHPPKRLLVIHGVGGVGKSTLLKMYRLSCRRRRIPVALVGGEEAPSPAAVLSDWADDLSGDKATLPAFQATLTHYRALQAKVEAEAKKSSEAMKQAAEKLGKAAAKTAVEMAASAIPVVGPLAAALGGAGAEAFVDWLRGFLSKPDLDLYLDPTKRLTDDFLSDLARAAARQRIALMADTYEQMTTLDDWMRDLAQRLPENVLLVIAGRAMPEWDRAWPGWMGRAGIVELKEMTPDDLRTLVHRYYAHIRGGEPDPQQVEAIVEFARGLPMAATTVVQLWVRHGVEDFSAVRPQVVADLVDRLLEGVPPEMQPAFEAAAVLRYFNADSLRALLDGGGADTLYAELRRWPFIRPRREGLAVHDTMREMMNEALRLRTPDRFLSLHERAAAYYEARLAKATEDEHERLTLERLYHRICTDEGAGIRLFQEAAEELARYLLVNRLRVLMNDVNTYPLEHENSRMWQEYYNARLAQIELRLLEAEKIYEAISENEGAEPKLRAYALLDSGLMLRRRRIGAPEILGKAIQCFKRSLEMVPLDSKLVFSLMELGPIYRDQGEWDKARDYLNTALEFFSERGDYYGMATALRYIKYFNAYKGDWKQMFAMHKKSIEIALTLKETTYLKSDILQGMAIAWIWAGRYSEATRNIREGVALVQKLLGPVRPSLATLRDWGYALGFSGDFVEANRLLSESLQESVRQAAYSQREEAVTLGFYGAILVKQGDLEKAREYLSRSLEMKLALKDNSYILETLNYLGALCQIENELLEAENYYTQSLSLRWTGRLYFECGALTGLVRVKHAQGQYDAISPLLTEAEQLAQQYEYNDHLASLRLTQGHIAWEPKTSEVCGDFGSLSGFDAALHFYQHALVYALRYNRFLLDEVLWGGGVATPLRPIIPHCLERGEEGRRMLIALRDWWQTGANDIGTPRPDTISPIPEGIPLLEAERMAREREPGDGSPQRTVVEQIEKALA